MVVMMLSTAEMMGMRNMPKATPMGSSDFQNMSWGVLDRFMPRKVKSILGIPARSGMAVTI